MNLRLGRQRIPTAPNGPPLWVVVDESALRRPIGGPEVMRGQLLHLLQAAKPK